MGPHGPSLFPELTQLVQFYLTDKVPGYLHGGPGGQKQDKVDGQSVDGDGDSRPSPGVEASSPWGVRIPVAKSSSEGK